MKKLTKKKKIGKYYYYRTKIFKTRSAAINKAKRLREQRTESGRRLKASVVEGKYKKETQFGVYTR